MQTDIEGDYTKIIDKITQIIDLNTKYAKDALNDASSLYDNSSTIMTIIIVVISIVALIMGMIIVKSITLPIELLSNLLSKVANRDLTIDAPIDYGAEFGQMFKEFNYMNSNLREIIGNVVMSSNTIKDASENVVD